MNPLIFTSTTTDIYGLFQFIEPENRAKFDSQEEIYKSIFEGTKLNSASNGYFYA